MLLLTHFKQHPSVIRVINALPVGIYPSVNSLNICTFTMELYQRQKYAVGEECFRDVTVSNSVYG